MSKVKSNKVKSFSFSKGLQESLEHTISTANEYSGKMNIEALALTKIELDPENPRDLSITIEDIKNGIDKSDPDYKKKNNELKQLSLLATSIKNDGLINPILVFKHADVYRVVAGERRTLASHIANATSIQAKILDQKPDDLKISILQWAENIHRDDLSLWERYKNLEKIINAYLSKKGVIINDVTSELVAEILNCSESQAFKYKSLLSAPNHIKDNVKNGLLNNLDKTYFLISSPEEYHQILLEASKNGLSIKQMKALITHHKSTLSKKQESRGRQATKVTIGTTKNLNAAKAIMNSVLQIKELEPYKESFELDWSDLKSINSTFQKILTLLEKNL